MEYRLDISWNTIIKVLFALLVFYAIFLVRDIVVWFFFALIIAILVEPIINFLRKLFIPKIVAVILIYLMLLALVGLLIYLTAPIFILEIYQLSQSIPVYFEQINPLLRGLGVNAAENFDDFTGNLIGALRESSASIFRALSVFFGGIASTVLIFTFAFYLSLENQAIEGFLKFVSPKKYEDQVLRIFEKSRWKVSKWFGSRLLACLFVGIFSFIIFFILSVKYAFTLALISGVLTFIPFIGPLITALLVLLVVGVSQSWLLAVYIVIALTILQQIENSIITPLLMKQFLAMPPLLVLVSVLIGGILFGFLGIIFAIPVFGIVYEFLKEFLAKKKQQEILT